MLASLADDPATLPALASWVGDGPNDPVAPQTLEQHIGPVRMDALAQRAGLTVAETAEKLAEELPLLVDTATPSDAQPTTEARPGDGTEVFAAAVGSLHAEQLQQHGQERTAGSVNVMQAADTNSSIAKIDVAIKATTDQLSHLGAFQNRLEPVVRGADYVTESLEASDSRVRDTNMTVEMASFTKNNILLQASQAMLARANQIPQGVLRLLG